MLPQLGAIETCLLFELDEFSSLSRFIAWSLFLSFSVTPECSFKFVLFALIFALKPLNASVSLHLISPTMITLKKTPQKSSS